MALLAFTGAEDSLNEVTVVNDVTRSSTQALSGSYSYRVNSGYSSPATLDVNLSAPASTIFFQSALFQGSGYNTYYEANLISWMYDTTVLGTVNLTSTGFQVYVGGSAKGSEIPYPKGINTNLAGLWEWGIIEAKIIIHDTSGEITLKINGQQVFTWTGDTKPGTDTQINKIRFGGNSAIAMSVTYWDDIVVWDDQGGIFDSWQTDFLKLSAIRPSGAGNYAQWTPSAGNNWDCVEEIPVSAADYVSSGTTGQKDSYVMTDAPIRVDDGDIKAVAARYWGEGNGTIKRLVRINSTDYLGSALTLPASLGKVEDIMYQNPAGGNWTKAIINSLESGMESDTVPAQVDGHVDYIISSEASNIGGISVDVFQELNKGAGGISVDVFTPLYFGLGGTSVFIFGSEQAPPTVTQHGLQVLSNNEGVHAHDLIPLSRNDGVQQHSLYVLSLEQTTEGPVSAQLEKITASGTGIVNIAGPLNATLAKVVASGEGKLMVRGELRATLKNITASGFGGQIKENYFDLNLEVSGRKRRYEFPQDDRDRIGDADIEEPETPIAALVPVVEPSVEPPKTADDKVNDLSNDATLLITRSNDILDVLTKVCANLIFAVDQGDMITRSALLALHLDQDKMSFNDYLDVLRLQVELSTHVGQTAHINEVMTNAGSQSETVIKFYESNLQNNISDAAVWAMQAKPIIKSASTGQAVNDFLNSYNDYPINNTIVDAMGGESQTTLGRIIAECIPCLQRTLSMSNFNPLEEILNLLQAEITKRLNYLQSLWNSLINGQTINICDLMNFLNSMCIPDLFAVLASLSHYWLQLTDLHKTNVWGILWSLVQPLLQGLLMNFTSLIDRFLRLIMAPVECVITSIDHEYAKLYNLGHMEMREKQGLVVNPPYANNFSKWAHDQVINPAFNAKGPFGTSLLELKKALQNSNGWVNSQIKRLRDAIAEMLGQDGSALDNSQGLFMVLRWLALVIGLVKAIIKFKQDGFQCSQDGLTAPQYEVLLSYLSTTTGSPFVIDPTADPLNPTYPSADTDLDSIVQQLLTSDQTMKKPASPDAAVEVTQEATFIMPDCISQQKELERAKVADWITDLNNLTS